MECGEIGRVAAVIEPTGRNPCIVKTQAPLQKPRNAICRGIAKGQSNKVIAFNLNIVEHTV